MQQSFPLGPSTSAVSLSKIKEEGITPRIASLFHYLEDITKVLLGLSAFTYFVGIYLVLSLNYVEPLWISPVMNMNRKHPPAKLIDCLEMVYIVGGCLSCLVLVPVCLYLRTLYMESEPSQRSRLRVFLPFHSDWQISDSKLLSGWDWAQVWDDSVQELCEIRTTVFFRQRVEERLKPSANEQLEENSAKQATENS